MAKFNFKPRMRHVFIGILGTAVLISTIGSILELLRFDDGGSTTKSSVTAGPRAFFEEFKLETPSQFDGTTKASDGDAPIAVIRGRDVSISAKVQGVREVQVVAGVGSQDNAAKASAKPDASGHVSINLQLPKTDTVYIIQAYGIVNDRLIAGWEGGSYANHPAVTADTPIRIMAE